MPGPVTETLQPHTEDSGQVSACDETMRSACRVMVVDDDELMRIYLSSVLGAGGYEIDAVASGEEALELLESKVYDILLTDYQMPGMDGLTLCRRVREEPRCSSLYILMLTCKDSREDRDAGLTSGVNAYMIKGASRSEVLAKVDAGRRRRRDNDVSQGSIIQSK